MAKDPKAKLQIIASTKVQQILIALLFISMSFLGFSSGQGTGSQISKELSNMFGGDSELFQYIISALELACGLFLGAQFFVKAIPAKFVKLSLTVILVFWVVLIVILDILTVDFGGFDGSGWFVWIEQIVLHLIVLASILQIQN